MAGSYLMNKWVIVCVAGYGLFPLFGNYITQVVPVSASCRVSLTDALESVVLVVLLRKSHAYSLG